MLKCIRSAASAERRHQQFVDRIQLIADVDGSGRQASDIAGQTRPRTALTELKPLVRDQTFAGIQNSTPPSLPHTSARSSSLKANMVSPPIGSPDASGLTS